MAKRKKAPVQEAKTVEETPTPDEDVALDFAAIKRGFGSAFSWFSRWDAQRLGMAALLLIALLLTLWIRMQPIGLSVTDDWAESNIRQNLNNQFASQIQQQFPTLPAENRDALIAQKVEEYITQNPAEFAAIKKQFSAQLKDGFQYEDGDGDKHTYLGDLDSYFWLRYTRNWLNTGTTCDAVTPQGECRDTFVLAPVGVPSSFNPSLHVFAIGWLHLFITLFDPHFPLTATSMYVPVLLGLLAVIPAFFIGRKIAGNVGGFVAAVLIAVNPMHLSRSMGSDNDTWNIMMPLFAAWMLMEALDAKDWKRATGYAAASAAFVGLHAAAWAGWWLTYLVFLCGALGLVGFRVARDLIRGERKPWLDAGVRTALIATLMFYVGSLIALLPTTGAVGYLQIPLVATQASGSIDSAVANAYWPNVLTTVAELNKSSLAGAIGNFGGPLLFLASLVGVLLMILPRRGWRIGHYVALALGIALYAYLVNSGASKLVGLLILAAPVAAILLLDLIWGVGKEEEAHLGAALIILVWFIATTYATYSGVRFILLMVPAFGLGVGVLAGRVHEWVTRVLSREFPRATAWVAIGAFFIIALLLIQPVKAGYATAHGFIPSIDDAWWGALTKIRDETPTDAVINSWWDFGHWFKYVAERRVTADGTTQHTHVPRWLGLALVTPDEREAVGVLRMLDCGSDATPQAEGALGAYGIATEALGDPIKAQDLVRELVTLDRADAARAIADAGIDDQTAARLLERTHCEPPADYFITSSDMIGKAGVWAHFGLWDFNRAYAVAQVQQESQQTAVSRIAERLGVTPQEATSIYVDIQKRRQPNGAWDEGALNAWIAPWPGYLTGGWVGCTRAENGTVLQCPAGVGISQSNGQTLAIDGFVYNTTAPERSIVVIGAYVNGQRVGQQANATVESIIVADDTLRKLANPNPTINGISILIDVKQDRMLIASSQLAESQFTRLYYLDGRYSKAFKKFDDRSSPVTGARIITWQVDWDAYDQPEQTGTAARARIVDRSAVSEG